MPFRLDCHGAVAADGSDEFLGAPPSLVLDPMRHCHGDEHDRQVRVDRFAFVVVDWACPEVMLGHPKAFSMCHNW